MDDDQGSTQGSSYANCNHRSLQVIDGESRGDAQAIMARSPCKLLLSKSASQTGCFALLTIRSLLTCEKGQDIAKTIPEIPCPVGVPGRNTKGKKGKTSNGFNIEDAM